MKNETNRKNKITFKLGIISLVIILIAIVLIAAGFMGVGCTRRALRGTDFEVSGWQLFRYNRSSEPQSRQIAIRALRNKSLIKDGVLTIPTQVGRYRIDRLESLWVSDSNTLVMLVVPAEIILRPSAQGLQGGREFRYVEFLCGVFEKIYSFSANNIIIPDGTKQNLISRAIALHIPYSQFNIIERSQFKGIS